MIKMILVEPLSILFIVPKYMNMLTEDIFVLIPLYWYKSGNEDKPYHLFIVNIIYP